MIERPARVIAIHAEIMQVEVDSASACGQCRSKKNCHGEHSTRVFVLPRAPGLQAGDAVNLGLAAHSLERAALLAYGVPALSLVLGALLGSWLGQNDVASMIGSALGLAGSLLAVRLLAYLFRDTCLKANVEATLQAPNFQTGS